MKNVIFLFLTLFTCLGSVAQIPTSGLLHRYTFDNTFANTAATHTLAGGTGNYVPDRNSVTNGAQNIISTSTFSSAGIPNLPVASASRTVAFWYKSNSNALHSLFNYGASSNYFGIVYEASPSQILVGGGSSSLTYPFTYTGNWTHIAVTYNGTNTTIYFNGTAVSSTAGITFATTASPVSRIGVSPFGGNYNNFIIDDLLIYDRAITATEVGNIFLACDAPANTTPSQNLAVCTGASTTLSVSGSNISWFANPTGGTALGTGNSFTTPNLTANTTYYAEAAGCATRRAITVTVVAPPTNTTPTANLSICAGSTTTLNVTGGGVSWYDSPAGGSILGIANSYTTAALNATTTFYAQEGGCLTRVPITVSVLSNTTPAANLSICPGSTTMLSAGGSTISWFANLTGGTALGTGNNFTTPALNTNTTYYAQSAGCPTRLGVTVSMAPGTSATIQLVNDTIRSINTFDTYKLKRDGVVVDSSNTTGNINYRTTGCGNYQAFFTNTVNSCPNVTATISRVNTGGTMTSCGGTVSVPGVQVPLQYGVGGFPGQTNPGVGPSSPSTTFSFWWRSNGTCATLAPGTYYIQVKGANGCVYEFPAPMNAGSQTTTATSSSTSDSLTSCIIASNTVVVNTLASAPTNTTTAQNQITCTGLSAPLSASGTGTLSWYNVATGGSVLGTGTTFNTPSITVSPTTFYVESTQGSCVSSRTPIVVTLHPVPAMPVSNTPASNLTICSGNGTTLSVTPAVSGFNTSWWTTPTGTGTTFIQIGSSLTLSASSIPTSTSFWVETQNTTTGCRSTRLEIPVVVNTTPARPTNTSTTIFGCMGSPVTVSVSGTGTIEWFDASSGGNLLGTGSSYTQANFTTGTTFFASAKVGNCVSPRESIYIQLAATPNNPNVSGTNTICTGQRLFITNVSANQANHSLKWYAAATGGAVLSTDTFRTPVLTTTTTYYVTSYSIGSGCESSRVPVLVTVSTPVITGITATIDTSYCPGQATSLTATATGSSLTYSWSSGTFGATTSVSPSVTTTYTVTVTSAPANCTVSATKTIVVIPTFTASIAGPDSICPGVATTLTAIGGATYAWSNGLGSGAVKSVSPTANTTYTVTVTSGTCQATATKTISLKQAPAAGFGQSAFSVCSGASVTLTGAGNVAGSTYAWSTGQTGTPITTIPTTTPTTTYTLTVTAPNGCSTSDSRSVTVNNVVAAISGPTTVCTGTSATLLASGGTIFAWSNGGGTMQQASFTPAANTTYTVTVTGAGNCTATASQTVSVQSAPTATITGATSICNGASTTLTANGGNTYTWANGLGANAAITVNPTQTTTYTVTVSIGANCTASATKTLTVKQPTASTRSQTICQGTSFSFKGQNLRTAGTYRDTIMNIAGCDSVITLNLTVTPAIQRQMNQTICKGTSYTFKGQNLSTAGTYRDTTSTVQGCDSITILTLTVTPAIQRQISQTICFGTSFSFKGQTLTQTGTYRDTTQTAQGCDSITTLTLNVRNKSTSTINAGLCTGQSYSFKGQSLTQAGQYLDTVQTTAGCDSFVTLNLTVGSFVTGTATKAICQGESYTFNGQSLTQAGQYLDTLTSAGGCDSILTLTLTVNALPTPTITKTGASLSTQTFASYQWKLNGTNITGAISQNYTATQNGSYTLEVTDANGCKNTSAAVQVTGLSIDNTRNDLKVSIYPNPANDVLNIEVEAKEFTLTITDIAGRKMMVAENQKAITLSQLASGVYNIEIKTESGIARKQFIKK